MTADWLLCGWRVQSELPLSVLPAWNGDDRPPDLTITLGAIPLWSEAEFIGHGHVQISREGSYRFCVPQIATYCIDATGQKIVIELACNANVPEIQEFLFGPVLVILCQRRNVWPLHASCVLLGDTAVAFTGPSGAGKSTLAAAFQAHGCEVLSDDITVIDLAAGEGAMVLPSVPRVKLWRDTVACIGLSITQTENSSNPLRKEILPLSQSFSSLPRSLATIYYIESVDSIMCVQPLRGMKAVIEISKATHRRRLMKDLCGGRNTFLENATRIAAAIPAHRRLDRPLSFAALPDLVNFIVEQEKNRYA